MKLLAIWVVVLALAVLQSEGVPLKRSRRTVNASTREAPTFTKTQHTGYEERLYEAKKWVCSNYNNTGSERISAYMRLHYYTQGNNTNGVTIPRTSPVAIDIKSAAGSSSPSYSYCFFIPESFQSDTPAPLDSSVYVIDRPVMTVFTRGIGGFPSEQDFKNEETHLRSVVGGDDHQVKGDHVIRAMYTPPWITTNRRNELWLLKA